MARRASILIIYMGGTIGMKTDSSTGALAPFDFSQIYEEFPSLRRLNVDIDIYTFEPVIDSSNVSAANWRELAEVIKERYLTYDGFVVLHGTDTMSYTASALSFMLENLSKPVVFTGSQIPIGVLRTDGRENLITAIEIAGANVDGRAIVPEVSLYFQNKLFRANRTTKRSAEALNAFHSPNFPPLAEVGVNISYNNHLLHSCTQGELSIAANISDAIAVVKLYPTLSVSLLERIFDSESLRAVILESYGAGNAPTTPQFSDVIRRAVEAGMIVLNITQCASGSVEMSLYQTGVELQRAGVLSGYDMTLEAATTKLGYLLGKYESQKMVIEAIKCNLRGEMSR